MCAEREGKLGHSLLPWASSTVGDLRSEERGDAFLHFLRVSWMGQPLEPVSDRQITVRDLFLGFGSSVGVSLKLSSIVQTQTRYPF